MIFLILAFFCNKISILWQNSTFIQSNSMKARYQILSYIFSFCKIKDCYYWKSKFNNFCVQEPASGLLQIVLNWGNDNDVTTFRKCINFFWTYSISLVKFSYKPKFHVNIMTGVTNFFTHKGLTRNLEIVNTPVWIMPSILRLGQKLNTKISVKY